MVGIHGGFGDLEKCSVQREQLLRASIYPCNISMCLGLLLFPLNK